MLRSAGRLKDSVIRHKRKFRCLKSQGMHANTEMKGYQRPVFCVSYVLCMSLHKSLSYIVFFFTDVMKVLLDSFLHEQKQYMGTFRMVNFLYVLLCLVSMS